MTANAMKPFMARCKKVKRASASCCVQAHAPSAIITGKTKYSSGPTKPIAKAANTRATASPAIARFGRVITYPIKKSFLPSSMPLCRRIA